MLCYLISGGYLCENSRVISEEYAKRKSLKVLIRGVSVLILCSLFTGCMNVVSSLTVDYNGHIGGEYFVEVNKSLAAFTGITDLNSFKAFMLKENGGDIKDLKVTWGETSDSYEVRLSTNKKYLPTSSGDDISTTWLPDGRLKLVFRNEGSKDWVPDAESPFSMGKIFFSLHWKEYMTPVEWSKDFYLRHTYLHLEIPSQKPVPEAFVIFDVPKKFRGGPFLLCVKGEKIRVLKDRKKLCPKGYERGN
jgi:hypothetical protein